MSIEVAGRQNGPLTVFELRGELTRDAEPALDLIRAGAAGKDRVLMDFTGVTHFTSSGFGLLLDLLRQCARMDIRVWASGLDEHHEKIARIMGLTEYMDVVSGEAELLGEAQPALPILRIDCLGPFSVTRGETPITRWRRQKGRALLQYLASRRQHRVPAPVLLAEIWGDDSTGSNVLNTTVSDLRKDLTAGMDADNGRAGGYIVIRNGLVELPRELVDVDLDRFHRTAAAANDAWERGDTRQAAGMYQELKRLLTGDPFTGEPYNYYWMENVRDHVRQRYSAAMCRLALWHEAQGEHPAAEETLRMLTQQQPLNENASRDLMALLHRLGRYNEARQVFHRLEERLRLELNCSPEPETLECYRRCASSL